MKTALDKLLETLETGTWTPPAWARITLPAPMPSESIRRASSVTPTARNTTKVKDEPYVEEPVPARKPVASCGSPDCGGCYLVDPGAGARIHPPKCGEDYRAWLERWDAKGKVQ